MPQLTEYVKSGSRLPGIDTPLESVVIGLPETPTELIIYQGKIYVYDTQGQTLIDGGYISANAFAAASITASRLSLNSQRYINTIQFTATDDNTCSWNAGSVIFSDGTDVVVYAGNTGNITTTTYVYYNGSSQTLQTTTSTSIAIGGSNMPLAIVEPVATGSGKCLVSPFIAVGTTIDGDKIITGRISSKNSRTYFDLNDGRFQVNDETSDRVVIGKMSDDSYGIKASLPGYTADVDTDVNHYALWATSDDSVDNVLIKEKTRGSTVVDGETEEQIEHGLGYVPFVLVFTLTAGGVYTKTYGGDVDLDCIYYFIDTTYVTLVNGTLDDVTFKYYIFYDRVATGNYEEIYVHDYTPVMDGVIL